MSAFDEAWSVIEKAWSKSRGWSKGRGPVQMKLPDEDNEMHPSWNWELYDRATAHLTNKPSFQTWMEDKGKINEPSALPAELQYQQRSRNVAQLNLVDDKGRVLSRFDIDPVDRDSWGSTELDELRDRGLGDFYGETPSGFRRQGHYRTLFNNTLRHGIDILSDSRGRDSNPFHEKYMATLPSDIRVSRDKAPRWDDDEDEEDDGALDMYDALSYSAKPAWFPEGWGDLRGPHNIQVPFRVIQPEVKPVSPKSDIVTRNENGQVVSMRQTALPISPLKDPQFYPWQSPLNPNNGSASPSHVNQQGMAIGNPSFMSPTYLRDNF